MQAHGYRSCCEGVLERLGRYCRSFGQLKKYPEITEKNMRIEREVFKFMRRFR
jgi:hypothetical protein